VEWVLQHKKRQGSYYYISFLKKKTKKNFFEPHPGKEQEKGENI